MVYVGDGNSQMRLPRSEWAMPECQGVTQDQKLRTYAEALANHTVEYARTILQPLVGKTLVCDCPPGVLCQAQVLATLTSHVF